MPVVVLDPGHNSYGHDTGAEGNGLLEQDLTLYICRKLKPMLELNGFKVVLTRDGDLVTGLSSGFSLVQSLQAKCDISNNVNADIFVAIHINAGGGTGQEILIYGTGGKAETLAKRVLPYLVNAGQWANRGVKIAHDYVTGPNTNAPAILTESGFIDSSSDASKLKSKPFLDTIAVAHAKGICDYFGIAYVDGPAPSAVPVSVPPVATLKYTYPNNAKVINDDLYIRDANGNTIPGRYVSKGDRITVLDVSGSKQLCLVEYPTPTGVKSGYVANVVSCIQYIYQSQWQNGSTMEAVLDEIGGSLGSLNPRESATPLYRKKGKLHVVYATNKGANTKSGYVAWNGGFSKF